MTTECEESVLGHLRALRGDLAGLRQDIRDVKGRLSALEGHSAAMPQEIADLRLTLDRHVDRLDRIERGLDAPPR